ncbi:MAG TPA: GNAT family N-acetyltransferase [Clostridiales bacterium]|nr:GNAT family N-acetyltransferase [Clostridiales bacterium]
MLIQGKLLCYGDDLSEVMDIRRKVFVEEFGMSEELEFDGLDLEAMHVIVYEEGQSVKEESGEALKIPVATGRIIYDGTLCMIEKVAVLKEYRGKQYGDFTVRMLLTKAFTSGIDEVTVKTFPESEDFFRTIGFVKHKEYTEQGIRFSDMFMKQSDLIKLCAKCK